MTGWAPGDGDLEVLSSGGERTSRPSTAQAVVRLLLCLGAAIALGAHGLAGRVVATESADPTMLGPVTGCSPERPVAVTHRSPCPPGRPARAGELAGTWLRVGVQGVWRGAGGREFMRFEPDGRFVWGLTGPYRDMRGRYTQDAGTVTVTLDRWSLCRAGDTSTWQAALDGGDRLHLVDVSGAERTCVTATTGGWSARRLQVVTAPGPHILAPHWARGPVQMTLPGHGVRTSPVPNVGR